MEQDKYPSKHEKIKSHLFPGKTWDMSVLIKLLTTVNKADHVTILCHILLEMLCIIH